MCLELFFLIFKCEPYPNGEYWVGNGYKPGCKSGYYRCRHADSNDECCTDTNCGRAHKTPMKTFAITPLMTPFTTPVTTPLLTPRLKIKSQELKFQAKKEMLLLIFVSHSVNN
ncbi:hypothetical protein TVAG_285580 [Trichomonas vaginalis G3]|uniref:Uncharacterized protein n=1 Tax=Trichomonas vaginalis (strain ATCC PRA-98 / G3) TaxID=412133 RepID=A2FUB6_TRIV3|nr:hypothetical protein TVAGG3_0919150 [Trichomonas vaginalis G3]EAX91506.1 hypothetical protein TVAG_285580 [Trichomonas vaginalis G3]KAI5485029.1 hypothetical protein TVAGG3_0919150 [Trichomonas vaginalis G3]|eukprot:XP_001304436.1 hypothetical protein [Trichomonas vaginalis G3]